MSGCRRQRPSAGDWRRCPRGSSARQPRQLRQRHHAEAGRRERRYCNRDPGDNSRQADVIGVWLGFGVGINKQYFIIRKVGNKLRGMVCGRCDNPYTMAVLDDFEIKGDTMKFDIIHEDWGPGSLPFHNQATVHVAGNEMRITSQQDNMPPGTTARRRTPASSLAGPGRDRGDGGEQLRLSSPDRDL